MEIYFKRQKLKRIVSSERLLIREFGSRNGRLIMRRMGVLAAAESLADVPNQRPERCHQLEGARKGQFAVDIQQPFRIVFEPYHEPAPLTEEGGLDLSRITRIRILNIEDYHG